MLEEFEKESRDVTAMNLVADLLSLIPDDRIITTDYGAEDNVCQETMQLHRGMVRTGKTAGAKDSNRHLEVAAKFLAHYVCRYFRCPENGMQTGIDGHALVNGINSIPVVISLFQLDERKRIRPIAINLIGTGKAKRRIAAKITSGNQDVQCPDRVDIEIIIGYGCGFVVRRLSCRVDDEVGTLGLEQRPDRGAVPYIYRKVSIARPVDRQLFNDRPSAAFGSEELLPHVVVYSNDLPSFFTQKPNTLRPYQST